VGLLGGLALRRLDTPEFKDSLTRRAGAALGTTVRVERLELGVLSGLRLEGAAIGNPAPLRGDLLTADAIVLKHRLWPLLAGRVVIDNLELRRPNLALVPDARGIFNYERLGGAARSKAAVPAALPLRVTLERFGIEDGTLTVSDATRTALLRLDRLAVNASVDAGPEGMRSDARLRGALSSSGFAGTLFAEARVERRGSAGLPTGQGHADVRDCRVERSALFSLLATTLQLPELARPELDECRVEFRLGGGRVVTPVVALKGKPVQVTGTGSLALATGALDYEMELALRAELLGRLSVKELRAAFKDRGDGYGVLAFKLGGTTAKPATDIPARLAKAAADEAAKGKLKGILGKVF